MACRGLTAGCAGFLSEVRGWKGPGWGPLPEKRYGICTTWMLSWLPGGRVKPSILKMFFSE